MKAKQVTCIVLDDEPLGREIVENFVHQTPFLTLLASFENPIEALHFLETTEVDLILSDIQMPKLNGLEFIRSLNHLPAFIFITAHRDFALDGFDYGAIDYLVKPIRFDRFLKAVNRVKDSLYKESSMVLFEEQAHTKPYIFVKVDGKLEKITLTNILYIEAFGDYLKVITTTDLFITHATLKSMEEVLLPPNFLRVQRSFIINIATIQTFSGNTLILENGKSISISLAKKEELYKVLGI